ncbi:hypothetical protein GGX14DRAFT_467043 [Mycena pura]|uniref:Secreted protein n=1 Tax=Mycena pura TaxID=153505 RepID=A0AAD6V8F7_9AGAR|nr:hypothetical protein GGX14DRAFT_467043 [Mycena pura]
MPTQRHLIAHLANILRALGGAVASMCAYRRPRLSIIPAPAAHACLHWWRHSRPTPTYDAAARHPPPVSSNTRIRARLSRTRHTRAAPHRMRNAHDSHADSSLTTSRQPPFPAATRS